MGFQQKIERVDTTLVSESIVSPSFDLVQQKKTSCSNALHLEILNTSTQLPQH